MKLIVTVEVGDEADRFVDPEHETGLTTEGYDRLSGHTEEFGSPPLGWLGEIADVEREEQ